MSTVMEKEEAHRLIDRMPPQATPSIERNLKKVNEMNNVTPYSHGCAAADRRPARDRMKCLDFLLISG
jgi:hypothetical protein